ncbi:phosphoglycan beta 1,3 galactosyltransferase [Anopheles sinensis]|uniref:Phosphoglycan beta 1,3 galactosyltransferase n=1 Tax=Anopheles sinensis TaxID=74873 RepID=A0A084WS92_ANOSI|nr:phosphoglycan beta 1,3 galactosyltransferase [Anopheles sinensis]
MPPWVSRAEPIPWTRLRTGSGGDGKIRSVHGVQRGPVRQARRIPPPSRVWFARFFDRLRSTPSDDAFALVAA